MTKVTLTSLTATQSPTSKKSQLTQLWNDIEKKRLRNQRYQAKLDTFYQDFKASTAELEQAVCLATESWIYHLLSFMPRKTIKGAQREELCEWIQEELSILESNPFNPVNTKAIRDAFHQALMADAARQPAPDDIPPEVLDAFRAEFEMMLGQNMALSDQELMDMVKDPHKFQTYLQQLLAEKMDAEHGEEDMDWGAEDFFSETRSDDGWAPDANETAKTLFSDKQMTKLYRQLAKQLHPDKETDTSQKAEKSQLMQQLSQAKKDKDVVALLLMAQQYLPAHEMVLDDNMLARLQVSLKQKVAQLNSEFRELQHGDDLKSIIWRKFGGGNKASRDRGLSKYRDTLQQETEELHLKCQATKTVKQMQQHLKERVDATRYYEQLIRIDRASFSHAEDDWF